MKYRSRSPEELKEKFERKEERRGSKWKIKPGLITFINLVVLLLVFGYFAIRTERHAKDLGFQYQFHEWQLMASCTNTICSFKALKSFETTTKSDALNIDTLEWQIKNETDQIVFSASETASWYDTRIDLPRGITARERVIVLLKEKGRVLLSMQVREAEKPRDQ